MPRAMHPDHLQPGDRVGPWLITQVLGQGGSSRVFKVERDGRPYSMKLALRPLREARENLTEEEYVEERSAWRRLAREAAALFAYSSHPNLLRVYGVDFWPSPDTGYPFLITDYVDGDSWHEWRWRVLPHANRLVRAFRDVVRTVGVLHAHNVYHRDLKAENILIRRTDGRPFLIDFGTARLPGALTQTLGLPEGVLHLVPPELLAYARDQGWKRGQPFQGGVSADLYALGVLLYQGLTDLHPFNPELPDKELVTLIATRPPEAPHLLNPLAPRSLGDIAMKLMEKRPEDRYPNTEQLLRALDMASDKEQDSPAWNVPLFTPEAIAAPPLQSSVTVLARPPSEGLEAPTSDGDGAVVGPEAQPLTLTGEPLPPSSETTPGEASSTQGTVARRPSRARGYRVLFGVLAWVGVGLSLAHLTLASSPEALQSGTGHPPKGNPPVSTTSPPTSSRFTLWLCAVAGLGCPSVQVKPPAPEDCPRAATQAMSEELKIHTGSDLYALVDVKQSGDTPHLGVYTDGEVIGQITRGAGLLVAGTFLHGRLWTGPDIYDVETTEKRPAVMGRYVLAVLPDGRKFPVCIVIGNDDGRIPKLEGSNPGAAVFKREVPVSVVWRWP